MRDEELASSSSPAHAGTMVLAGAVPRLPTGNFKPMSDIINEKCQIHSMVSVIGVVSMVKDAIKTRKGIQ